MTKLQCNSFVWHSTKRDIIDGDWEIYSWDSFDVSWVRKLIPFYFCLSFTEGNDEIAHWIVGIFSNSW